MTETTTLGRPTDYRPEYDAKIIELAETMNLYNIADSFGVSYKTMWSWTDKFDSFRNAYARAKTKRAAKWLQWCEDNLDNRHANHNLVSLLLKQEAQMASERTVALKLTGNTPTEKAQSIIDSLAEGILSAKEFSSIMSGMSSVINIEIAKNVKVAIQEIKEEMKDRK